MGLYRNDGLAVVEATPSQVDDLTKKVAAILKEMGLSLTFKVNMSATDFLDVKLDLDANELKPYMKPNDTPLYIDTKSNDPPHIFRNLPDIESRRIPAVKKGPQNEEEERQEYDPLHPAVLWSCEDNCHCLRNKANCKALHQEKMSNLSKSLQ